jgi:hypothetical protein
VWRLAPVDSFARGGKDNKAGDAIPQSFTDDGAEDALFKALNPRS